MATAQGQRVAIVVEPQAVVEHEAKKALLWTTLAVAEAAHAATRFRNPGRQSM